MKKPNIFDMLADVEQPIFDQSAITVRDIKQHLKCGLTKARNIASDKVKSGQWERVWKKIDTQTVQAYRPKK